MISTEKARAIAADWHGGQWSALYSFTSTGKVWNEDHRNTSLSEIREEIERIHSYTEGQPFSLTASANLAELSDLLEYIKLA